MMMVMMIVTYILRLSDAGDVRYSEGDGLEERE